MLSNGMEYVHLVTFSCSQCGLVLREIYQTHFSPPSQKPCPNCDLMEIVAERLARGGS